MISWGFFALLLATKLRSRSYINVDRLGRLRGCDGTTIWFTLTPSRRFFFGQRLVFLNWVLCHGWVKHVRRRYIGVYRLVWLSGASKSLTLLNHFQKFADLLFVNWAFAIGVKVFEDALENIIVEVGRSGHHFRQKHLGECFKLFFVEVAIGVYRSVVDKDFIYLLLICLFGFHLTVFAQNITFSQI